MKQIAEAFGRRLKDTGVTRIQWIAMYYISTHKIISQRELSILMRVTDSSIGRLLDRLERDEMVIRLTNESDRRVTMVMLTERGEVLIKKLIPYGDAFNNDLTEDIKQEDLIVFENVLEKMIENIKK
ncbi:MAG: MarR family transcriptional regulator [Clostridiaceae bacterium]|nr:MarR family transcriptional regulator [Clostridiaceae bacterium]